MALAQGIIQTARAIGADPLDLATVISYETAGTFDPLKRGPTTQWGQHRGLIQFGEPQARQYGVNWNDPLGSQLGPDGAVARYFKASGYRPGMGLLDLYSTVNAGAPGLYNRTDANNGGAPGTVRDKVENQMAGHRRIAERLLGMAGDDTVVGGLGLRPAGQEDRLEAPESRMEATPMEYESPRGLLGRIAPNLDPQLRDRLRSGMAGLGALGITGPNRAVQQEVANRRQEFRQQRAQAQARAQEQQQRNRTLQVLGQMYGTDSEAYRLAASGAISPAQAVQLIQQARQGGGPNYKEVGGRIFDMSNPQAGPVWEPGGSGTLTEDQASSLNELRDDARTDLEPYELARQGFESIQTFSEGGPVSDYALAVAFAKVLDPGSVAREGEVAAVANAGSLSASLQQAIVRQLQNREGQLPPSIRQEIVRLATEQYNIAAESGQQTLGRYRDTARAVGIPEETRVYMGDDPYFFEGAASVNRPARRPGSDPAAPAADPAREGVAAPAPAPVPRITLDDGRTISREALTEAISKLSPGELALFQRMQDPKNRLDFLMRKGYLQ